MQEGRPTAWGSVLRSALLFTPIFAVIAVTLALLVMQSMSEGASAGRVVAIVLIGIVGSLIGYQMLQSVRDLFSRLVETEGLVERRWDRSDFFIFKNTYIFVESNVFRLEPELALDVQLGDTVRVLHFPHTGTVEQIAVVSNGGASGEPDDGN